jgi:tRNA(Arg) A34 adenosine deaminase TadA
MATTPGTGSGTAAALLPHLFPERKPITPEQITAGVEAALAVQRRAVTFGKRPFAAALLGPDNETVLLTHQSIDQVNHAESSLARLAYTHYSKEFLWQCTLVSTWEPCGMCTATIYVSFSQVQAYLVDKVRLGDESGNATAKKKKKSCADLLCSGREPAMTRYGSGKSALT